jgi:flavin prenyltransferase
MRLVIGITGATGVVYGIRLLEVLSAIKGVETHLVISKAGATTIRCETESDISDVTRLASYSYAFDDMAALISSGSFQRDGMAIVPCSVKTMSGIAHCYADNLILRAADVTLKERKKLVLAVRETPLHLGHIRNMELLTEMGAVIMPPVPAFYGRPRSLADIVDHTVGRMLDIFGVEHALFERWSGSGEPGD